ncbi:MAG: hypothetical protein KUG77_28625, partial [Nannocystaceae bacterium]|nr:hypothetical protein [Nannocystaceae bacterium]
ETGYRLVPAGEAAGVKVWIHLDPDGVRVQTEGTAQRVEMVSAGVPELVILEVLQTTTALVDEVRPEARDSRPGVVLDLNGSDADPQLRARLQAGLLERGAVITRKPTAEDRRLCVFTDGDVVRLHATGGDQRCGSPSEADPVVSVRAIDQGRRTSLIDGATAALERLEIRAAPEPKPKPPAFLDDAPAEVPDLDPKIEPELHEPRTDVVRPSVSLSAHGGVVGRSGGTDGLVGLRVRAGGSRGVGGGLDLTLIPSSVAGLRVVETIPTAIVDWRRGFARRGLTILGAFAGVHLHGFRHVGAAQSRGVRVGPSFGAVVRLAWLSKPGLMAFGGLRAGWSGGRWIHVRDGSEVWERSAVVVAAELGLGWDFPWGASDG